MGNVQLQIKGMVCPRCIKVVKEELTNIGLRIKKIQLGAVWVSNLDKVDISIVEGVLNKEGFQLLKNREEKIIEEIKIIVIEMIHHNPTTGALRNSDYISSKLGRSYSALSKLFSKQEKTTLEKFIILQKIERVKELLEYGELTLSEIALSLGYSNVHYLSTQFKNITGMSVSEYKNTNGMRTFISDI